MKTNWKLLCTIVAAGILVQGCARSYVVRMNNGVRFTTSSKPKLKGGSYYFKDATGRERSIPQGRVHEIMPASRAKEETGFLKSGS